MLSGSLDYGYTNIHNTWTGSKPEDLMWLPSGSTNWIKNWFQNILYKNGTNG